MVDARAKVPLISIIDDDESIRLGVVSLVKSIGFDARSFDSADRYLNSAERSETSCIVSDIQMPGTSGLDLQTRLAAQADRTPIIFITAFPRFDVQKRALAAGAFYFLAKPFDDQDLIDCIQTALKRRHLGDDATEPED